MSGTEEDGDCPAPAGAPTSLDLRQTRGDEMITFLAQWLPWLTLLVFMGGLVLRLVQWVRTPSPVRAPLFPTPVTRAGKAWAVAQEVLFFRSLFRGAKDLWAGSYAFHAMLALILVGHSRVFTWAVDKFLIGALGMAPDGVKTLSNTLGGAAGVVILLAGVYLLGRRLAERRVREITSGADWFAILLVLAVIVSGDMLRFVTHFDLAQSRAYFQALAGFRGDVVTLYPSDPWFTVHFLLAQTLLIYLPFSKLVHVGGVFFSHPLLQRG